MRYPANIAAQIAAFKAYVDCADIVGANPSSDDFEAAIELVIKNNTYEGANPFMPHFVWEIRNFRDVAGATSWEAPVSIGCSELATFGSTPTAEKIFFITLDLSIGETDADRVYFWRTHWNDGRLARHEVYDISKVEYPTLEKAIASAVFVMENDGKYLSKAA